MHVKQESSVGSLGASGIAHYELKEERSDDTSVFGDPITLVDVELADERSQTCTEQLPFERVDNVERGCLDDSCEPFLQVNIKEEYPGSTHSVMESVTGVSALTSHFYRAEEESRVNNMIEQEDYVEEGTLDLQHVHYTSDDEDNTAVNTVSRLEDSCHSGSNSAGENSNQCGHCEKSVVPKNGLKIHTRPHTGSKPYQCEICKKSFTRKGHLVIHTRTHTGSKPYQCGLCDKSFSQKASLVVHTRTHTGIKPYQCGHCDDTFRRKGDLLIHLHLHLTAHHLQELS